MSDMQGKRLDQAEDAALMPAFWRCRDCGCFWRDNHDDTVSLASVNEKSCQSCEWNPTSKACDPLYRAAPRAQGESQK